MKYRMPTRKEQIKAFGLKAYLITQYRRTGLFKTAEKIEQGVKV